MPSIIGFFSNKKNAGAIIALNFFLGWTFVGWVVTLVWVLVSEVEPKEVEPKTSGQEFAQSKTDKLDKLEQLKRLLDNGVLTKEEFEREKGRILG